MPSATGAIPAGIPHVAQTTRAGAGDHSHRSVSTEREIRAFMVYADTQWLRDPRTPTLRGRA